MLIPQELQLSQNVVTKKSIKLFFSIQYKMYISVIVNFKIEILMKRNLLLCTLAVCEYRLISQVVNEKGPESFFQC